MTACRSPLTQTYTRRGVLSGSRFSVLFGLQQLFPIWAPDENVGASWLMTALSPSPLIVAMVQAATSFPMFLLALPAGALADIADRRRLLLITQFWMLAAAAALSAATYAGAMSPALLLLLTFVLGVGAAVNGPAWQAIVGDLVGPRTSLAPQSH